MNLSEINTHTKEMANAIQRAQEFYTMTIEGKSYSIMLPTPQTCGTMTQQRTYAIDKAQQILIQIV